LNFLYNPSLLTKSRVDALTGHCQYNSNKMISMLGFKFDSPLEDAFIDFSSDLSHEN